MCFRPADASAGTGVSQCPECGKTIQTMGGIVLTDCPFCECPLQPAPAAPNIPGMPAIPGAPGTPKVPSA
ncbi:MAG: hypothetical protein IKV48_07555 [Eggerthellaceae bacterium]|nr:hypothetical protein [Eggerthellaceae bacterium]